MKKRTLTTVLALLMCLMMLLTACTPAAETETETTTEPEVSASAEPEVSEEPEASAEPEDTSFTVTDAVGTEHTFDAPATKVVALNPSDCEILYALDALDLLIGRGEYCDYPDDVVNVAAVQSGYETNIEQIISLDPDVLFMTTMAQTEEQVASLEAAGIKVVITNDGSESLEGVYNAINIVGKTVGKEAEAEIVVESMKANFDAIVAKVDGSLEGKTVYFEVSPLEYGLWTAGSGTFMDEIATLVGLTNAFADVSGWASISEEEVIERDPDYIVTISMYYGEGPTPVEEIAGREGWEDLTAVKNNAIYNADSNAISRPGPRLVDAATELYNFVYGE